MPGAAAVSLVGGVPLLHPQDQVFAAMLDGWGRQQQSRFLAGINDLGSPAVGGAVPPVDE